VDPSRIKPYTDNVDERRMKDRSESELPSETRSSKLSVDPSRHIPNTESVELSRTNERKLSAEPR
jgi:hypothetical protein